eukprot:1189353-Prorocentrum_minimum.AAC.2
MLAGRGLRRESLWVCRGGHRGSLKLTCQTACGTFSHDTIGTTNAEVQVVVSRDLKTKGRVHRRKSLSCSRIIHI